jgi:hypothetical protein
MTEFDTFVEGLPPSRRDDFRALHALVSDAAPELEPEMTARGIGYGRYRYRYASGRSGESFVVSIANNTRYISLYVESVYDGQYVAERYKERLPKADIGKSCIRFKRLSVLDAGVLRQVVRDAAAHLPGELIQD